MRVISPHRIHSKKVKSFRQIKKDAREMVELVNQDNFEGRYKSGFALAHCQVTKDPYRFFVIHREVKKGFGDDIIINPEVVKRTDKTHFREACLSYPFRTMTKVKRYNRVVVKYQVPSLFGLKDKTKEFTGLQAFIFQHEIDHFNSIYIYDKKS